MGAYSNSWVARRDGKKDWLHTEHVPRPKFGFELLGMKWGSTVCRGSLSHGGKSKSLVYVNANTHTHTHTQRERERERERESKCRNMQRIFAERLLRL